MAAGINGGALQFALHFAGKRVEFADAFHDIVEELDANAILIALGREDINHLAPHAVSAALQHHLVARVLHGGELADDLALVDLVALDHMQHHLEVGLGVAEAVDGGNTGDDDGIAPLHQCTRGREPHLLDVLVDGRILLDESIRRRHIGLGLVVVVIAHEILHRIVGEEFLELPIQLRRERLVGRHHQAGPLHGLDDIGNGVGLARAGHAQQGLVREPILETLDEPRNGLGLVAGRRPLLAQLEHGVFAPLQAGELVGGWLDNEVRHGWYRAHCSASLAYKPCQSGGRAPGGNPPPIRSRH